MYKIIKKTLAFTLAEVLVVIGIIGVVSALTIPNLNQNTGEKERVVKLQKIQSELNDALNRAQAEYGPAKTWARNDTTDTAKFKRFNERISEFMKVSKTCAPSTAGCFTNATPKSFRGGTTGTVWNLYGTNNAYYRYILADGTSVYYHFWNKDCNGFNAPDGSKTGCGYIIVDIDGPNKGPHQAGKDIFLFDFSYTYGVYPFGSTAVEYNVDNLYKDCFKTGRSCSAWVINNGNMDYLKADEDGKCPNGTLLSQTVTSCK